MTQIIWLMVCHCPLTVPAREAIQPTSLYRLLDGAQSCRLLELDLPRLPRLYV